MKHHNDIPVCLCSAPVAHDVHSFEAIDLVVAESEAAGLSENTRKSYRTGWNNWARWASAYSAQNYPASPEDIKRWLATLYIEGKKPDTLSTYLAAVAHKHRDLPGPNPADDPQVHRLLAGLKRMAADRGVTPRQAAPLRQSHIERIVEAAFEPRNNQPGGRKETPEQARQRALVDIALIILAYDAALRCCELLALTWGDIEFIEGPVGGVVHIRRSKTDQTGQGAVAAISVFAAQALARIRPADADPADRIFNFSPSTVTRRLKAAAEAAGIDPADISSHSTRVGMAQDLAASGVDMPGLMLAGRWKTAATVARYIRHLAAQHTPAAEYHKTHSLSLTILEPNQNNPEAALSSPARYENLPIAA